MGVVQIRNSVGHWGFLAARSSAGERFNDRASRRFALLQPIDLGGVYLQFTENFERMITHQQRMPLWEWVLVEKIQEYGKKKPRFPHRRYWIF